MLVTHEVRTGNFEAAEPYTDSLLHNMQLERWYRLVYAHVSTLERDYLKGHVRSSKDVRTAAFPHCLTLVYASTLVGSELPELGDIARLIVKSLGKVIDQYVKEKGYTEKLSKKKYVPLKHVDSDVVELFPSGLNWKINPTERLKLVLGICDAKNIQVKDKERLRRVMLGNGARIAEAAPMGSSDSIDEIHSFTTYTSYETFTTQTEEYMDATDATDAYGTPTSKLVDPTNRGKNNNKTGKGLWNKKSKKKDGESKILQFEDMEPWQKFVAQKTPPSTGPGKETTGAGGLRPTSPWDSTQPTNQPSPPVKYDDVPARPGWSPPKPKFDGDSLSFGPKLNNVADWMRRSSDS